MAIGFACLKYSDKPLEVLKFIFGLKIGIGTLYLIYRPYVFFLFDIFKIA
jgi:hypothetical protein